MAFKIQSSPTFWKNVELKMLDEQGREVRGVISVEYVRTPRSEIAAYLDEKKGGVYTIEDVLKVARNWKGAEDENGAIEFNEAGVRRFTEAVSTALVAIMQAYYRGNAGEAREGN